MDWIGCHHFLSFLLSLMMKISCAVLVFVCLLIYVLIVPNKHAYTPCMRNFLDLRKLTCCVGRLVGS